MYIACACGYPVKNSADGKRMVCEWTIAVRRNERCQRQHFSTKFPRRVVPVRVHLSKRGHGGLHTIRTLRVENKNRPMIIGHSVCVYIYVYNTGM